MEIDRKAGPVRELQLQCPPRLSARLAPSVEVPKAERSASGRGIRPETRYRPALSGGLRKGSTDRPRPGIQRRIPTKWIGDRDPAAIPPPATQTMHRGSW